MSANIQAKRIYEPAGSADGVRILIDRLWPRGLRKKDAKISLWLKEVAPSAELRRWFGHRPDRWEAFQKRYVRELESKPESIETVAAAVRRGKVTLLYGAHDTVHNHAVVLARYLRQKIGQA
ncbi:MAG: DUF488 domain-containing protein [Chromatiales bacterium]